jgi:hypothetical protein
MYLGLCEELELIENLLRVVRREVGSVLTNDKTIS